MSNRDARRRDRYRKTQKAYSKNPGETLKGILDGVFYREDSSSDTPSIADIDRTFRERLELTSNPDRELVTPLREPSDESLGAITPAEVRSALKSTKLSVAPGPDKWFDLSMAKTIGPTRLSAIFSTWWYLGMIPSPEKRCRTILIFKNKGDRKDVGNWRPITIGNTLIRLFAKIWDKRIRVTARIHTRQRAFIPADGCYESIKLLESAIQQSRRQKREVDIVFLDLAKAFDTVPHDSIRRALSRHGVHSRITSMVSEMYVGATTTVASGRECTAAISINSGVKQGCPLSPVLFNLIMDELVTEVDGLPTGVSIGESRVSIMAFADDLVLLSNSRSDMESLLKAASGFFDKRHLSVNARKCQSLQVLPCKGRASMRVTEEVHRWFGGVPIPSMTYEALAKYLGVHFDPHGKIVVKQTELETWCERLATAALKPYQKTMHQISESRIRYFCTACGFDRATHKRACHGPAELSWSCLLQQPTLKGRQVEASHQSR